MPASIVLWLPNCPQILITTGVVLAGCVAGVSVSLFWLDRHVPRLTENLPVMLCSLDHGVLYYLLTILSLTLRRAVVKFLRCAGVL